ncbi:MULTISPECIES: hypothetical protein [Acinetobacter]|uniref:Uncharacterized protein n=1 Tax=Acinetobacter higginsii TaxID=70347 RepID=N9SXY1_9GAMM|nr:MULTISPECIES: hypothetical protein [Acinetobacter]ENX56172.1 hypothetical protein F902_03269 [Acinetobacter higginsii]
MNIIAIATEVVGGPRDGDLVVCKSNRFDADRHRSQYARDHILLIPRMRFITYHKQTAYTDLNNKRYFRDYFVCAHTKSDDVFSSFRKSLVPIYLSKTK